MPNKYVPYVLSVVMVSATLLGLTLAGAFIIGVITGIWNGTGLFSAPLFLRMVADALFYEGGILLTIGALVEFLLRSYSIPLARRIMFPLSRADDAAMPSTPEGPGAAYSGGWMLIFSGALLLMASLAFAVMTMK